MWHHGNQHAVTYFVHNFLLFVDYCLVFGILHDGACIVISCVPD